MRNYIRASLRVSIEPCVYETEAATGSLITGSRLRLYTHRLKATTVSRLACEPVGMARIDKY